MRKHRFQKASSSRYTSLGSQSLHPHPWLFQRSSLSSHCQVFLSASSDSGKPRSSLLFGLCLPCGYFSHSLLTIEIVLGWDTDIAGCPKCHRQCNWPAWQSPLVGTTEAIWKLLKQETKQEVLKSPASLAMEELALVHDVNIPVVERPMMLGVPLLHTNTVIKICSCYSALHFDQSLTVKRKASMWGMEWLQT